MDFSLIFLIFTIFLLLVISGVIWVVLYLNRQHQQAILALQADSQAPFTQALQTVERLQAAQQTAFAETSEKLLQMALAETQRSQMSTLTALSEMQAESTRGMSSLTAQTTRMLSDAITLIGVKDPVAYQMVSGAQNPIYESGGQPSYTTSDPEGLLATVRAQDAGDQLLQRVMNGEFGSVGFNGTGVGFDPYASVQPVEPDPGQTLL